MLARARQGPARSLSNLLNSPPAARRETGDALFAIIADLDLNRRHLLTVTSDSKRIHSFWFRFPSVCVGLFRESDHSLIMSTATLADGQFTFKNPPRGEYRLVTIYRAFGTANGRVRVERGASTVIVRMRPSGIDTTSYIESL